MRITNHNGRYFLISTIHSILLVDMDEMEYVVIDQGRGFYTGITCSKEHIYCAATHAIREPQYSDVSGNSSEILIYNKKFELVTSLSPDFNMRSVHEILWHDDKLYVMCTEDNMVAIYDGETWSQWFPLGVPEGKFKDVNHLNSITIIDDKIFIVAHNWGNSKVYTFSLEEREKLDEFDIGNCAHNAWIDSNFGLCVCSSGEGIIRGEKGFFKNIGEWPRGIAFCKRKTVVGSSSIGMRKYNNAYSTTAHLYIYDEAWEICGMLRFEGEEQIYEVLSLEETSGISSLFKDEIYPKRKSFGIMRENTNSTNLTALLTLYSESNSKFCKVAVSEIDLRKQVTKLENRLANIENNVLRRQNPLLNILCNIKKNISVKLNSFPRLKKYITCLAIFLKIKKKDV